MSANKQLAVNNCAASDCATNECESEAFKFNGLVIGIVKLLKRLEDDRDSAERLLQSEKNRTSLLRKKIDWHAHRRMKVLPELVQAEHEQAAFDVQEIKWHCAYQARIETRWKEKVRIADQWNKKIMHEISFAEENSPLIEHKLSFEESNMTTIKQKQYETDIALSEAVTELKNVEHEFQQMKKQADHEQKMLAQRILVFSNDLKSLLESYLGYQKDHEKMCIQTTQFENKIIENEQLENCLVEEISHKQDEEDKLEKKVTSLVV